VFNLDADGNSLSPQQRQEMLLEQEKILKQIEEEKIANDRAIAELTAEEDYPSQRVQEPETSTGVAQGNVATAAPSGNVRTIEIAPNKRVALHGQDRTKEAIKKRNSGTYSMPQLSKLDASDSNCNTYVLSSL